jgi:hypothetical protein
LQLLARSLRFPSDLTLLRQRHTLKLLPSLHDSPLADAPTRRACLAVLIAAARLPDGARALLEEYGTLAWIVSVAERTAVRDGAEVTVAGANVGGSVTQGLVAIGTLLFQLLAHEPASMEQLRHITMAGRAVDTIWRATLRLGTDAADAASTPKLSSAVNPSPSVATSHSRTNYSGTSGTARALLAAMCARSLLALLSIPHIDGGATWRALGAESAMSLVMEAAHSRASVLSTSDEGDANNDKAVDPNDQVTGWIPKSDWALRLVVRFTILEEGELLGSTDDTYMPRSVLAVLARHVGALLIRRAAELLPLREQTVAVRRLSTSWLMQQNGSLNDETTMTSGERVPSITGAPMSGTCFHRQVERVWVSRTPLDECAAAYPFALSAVSRIRAI